MEDPAPRPRILLVESTRTRREAWRRLLETTFPDHAVDAARTGHEAWSLLRTRAYAAILAEAYLPDMPGLDLMDLARTQRPDALRVLLASPLDRDAGADAERQGRIHGGLARDMPSVDVEPTLRRIWARVPRA